MVRAVKCCCFQHGHRQRQKVLAEQEGAKGAGQSRQDQSLIGVDPAKVGHQGVVGDDDNLLRHQKRQDHEAKHKFLEGKFEEHHGVGSG